MNRESLRPPLRPEDHYQGPADAPIVLVEYGDFECPHSRRAYHVVREVLDRLGDRVRFVFRHFPITDVHRHASLAAEAAESVSVRAGNGAFWDMHDILFENQDALELDDLLGYAVAAGAEMDAVAADLATNAWQARVAADIESGMRSGVEATPAFFVNGARFDGDWTDPAGFADALLDAAFSPRYH
jgi:protein-disulfide isomerase